MKHFLAFSSFCCFFCCVLELIFSSRFTVIISWAHSPHTLPSISLIKAMFLTWRELTRIQTTCPMTAVFVRAEVSVAKSLRVIFECTVMLIIAQVGFNAYSLLAWLTDHVIFLPSETSIQLVETVEVVTTEMPEEDKPSSPLAQSPPAENSAGPSVPASREVKNRFEKNTDPPWNYNCLSKSVYMIVFMYRGCIRGAVPSCHTPLVSDEYGGVFFPLHLERSSLKNFASWRLCLNKQTYMPFDRIRINEQTISQFCEPSAHSGDNATLVGDL